MIDVFRAIFRNGTFVPQTPCNLPENSEVELSLRVATVTHPSVSDVNERVQVLQAVTDRMTENPLPAGAPRLSRDELHERG